MSFKRLFIVFLLSIQVLILGATKIFAQETKLVFDHINLPEFKDNSVFCMVQDKEGFLWFGTNNGLYKYDGYKATHYEYDPANKNSILTGAIRTLMFDKMGNLWIGIRGTGVCKMDIKDEKISRFVYNVKNPDQSISSNNVLSLGEDKLGNIWIGTEDSGVTMYNPQVKTFRSYNIHNSVLISNSIIKFFNDRNHGFHIGTHGGGLYLYDFASKKLIRDPRQELYHYSYDLISTLEDKHGFTWITTPKNILKFESNSGKLINSFSINYNNAKKNIGGSYVYEDRDGIIWVTSNNGTGLYKIEGNNIIHIRNLEPDSRTLSSNLVNCVFEDQAGIIWIGTSKGVNKLGYLQKRGLIRNFGMPMERFANEYSIRAVFKDKDNIIWAGSSGGGLLKIYPDGRIDKFKFLADSNIYGYNYINAILELDGHLWICSPRGLFDFDKHSEKFVRSYFSEKNPIRKVHSQYFSIWSVAAGFDKGYLLVGVRDSGLFYLNLVSGKADKYINIRNDSNSLPSNTIWGIYTDKNKNIWLCTDEGLSQASYKSGKLFLKNYTSDENSATKLHAHHIWGILEDKKGDFWISSTDGGLGHFYRKLGLFSNYTTKDNLPSNSITGMLEDEKGRIWVSTINGICVFDEMQEKGLVTYNISNGLSGNCFNYKSCWGGWDHHMIFGSTEGITDIDASNITMSNFNPNLTITLFDVVYKYSLADIISGKSITLPYKENSFAIEFASLDFTNPEKNNFAYRLEGLDTSWTYSKTRHYVSYSDLAPGHYIFHLKGTNSDGHWSQKNFIYHIYIVPPFWRRWWFVTLAFIVLISIIYFSVAGTIRRRTQKKLALLAQLTSLRAQLNPHFIFNALNSIQHFINSNEKIIANSFLSKFASLIRSTLENSSKETISIQEELDFLKIYTDLESVRLDKKVDFIFQLDKSIDPKNMRIPPMLIQPIIENSIIHGLVALQHHGEIVVNFRAENKQLFITVKDNGIGRERAKELNEGKHVKHVSTGSKLVMERLSLIGLIMGQNCSLNYVDIYNEYNEIAGTSAELILPL